MERAIVAASRWAAWLGGVFVLLMMLVTVVDVVLRYAFNSPFSGSFESIQLGMVLVVYCGLAWCGLAGGHVVISFAGPLLDRPRLRWLNALVHAVGALVFVAIAWRSGREALQYFASGETTNMLRAPIYPFMGAVAAGAFLFALVLGLLSARALRGAGVPGKAPV